jgi:type III pantothenate kinase
MNAVLAVDIGNTSASAGLCVGKRVVGVRHAPTRSSEAELRRMLAAVCKGRGVVGAVVASVVPAETPRWAEVVRRVVRREPLRLTHRLELGVRIDYPSPGRIGADRLANASGAVARYGAPVIVADFGTALTFDVIARGGTYVGGVIAPGLPLMTDYLLERTALLPHVELRGRIERVGRSTVGAMRLGAKVGYRGMVREIVLHVRKGRGLKDARLVATGGYARWALAGLDLPFTVDPTLTLYGLGRVFRLNEPLAELPSPDGRGGTRPSRIHGTYMISSDGGRGSTRAAGVPQEALNTKY